MSTVFRALILLFFCTGIVLLTAGCCQRATEHEALVVTLVTDTSGIGDKGFNQIAWNGLVRARDELGIIIKKIESSDPANYVKNLAIASRYGDLTIANGFLMLDAMKDVAELYPQYDFVFIDGLIEEPNVAAFTFRAEEVGFLAGVLAAGVSNTGRVGVLKGMEIPPVTRFDYGFRAGVKSADATWGSSTDVRALTAGDFNDPQKGFSITRQFLNDRRDIVYQLAGATALGAINAIRNASQDAYLIGVDLDQDDEIPGKVLTSTMKRIDNVVYEAVKAKLEGRFRGGHRSVGIAERALSLTDMRHTKAKIPQQVHAALATARRLMAEGAFTLPMSYEEVEEFEPVILQ